MNKFFILTLLILIPITSATYSGDSETIILTEQFDYYSIVGNSTPIDLTIIQNGLNVTITFNKYQQSDNFTIIFFNKEKEVITNTIYSGGGGGSTKYVDRNVTIEVPKFYDKNITNTVEVSTEVIKEVEIEPNPIWFYVSIFVIVLCIVFAILYLRSGSREEINNVERGFKENE